MIEDIYQKFVECGQRISTDTRRIENGSLFFALKGANFNGNTFALDALNLGASYAIVDEPVGKEDRIFLVDDVLKTLQNLATHHRKKFDFPFIAITGSNGKTTTKELTSRVLSAKYKTHYTTGNLNNHIGVPLTLLSIKAGTEIAVIEMGANHQGEIENLCNIALPTHGLITNVGKAHLEGFGGFEGVIKGKTELYKFLEKENGTIFCNSDNKWLAPICKHIKDVVYYGIDSGTVTGKLLNESPFVEMEWKTEKGKVIQHTNLSGNYNFENILAAIAIGNYFNVETDAISIAVESYIPSNQRSQLIKTKNNLVVADYYNANPTSMEKALLNFEKNFKGDKVVMLGDMFELGETEDQEHQQIVELVKKLDFSKAIFVGSRFSKLLSENGFLFFENSTQAASYLKTHPLINATVLIKGSRSSRMELIIESL